MYSLVELVVNKTYVPYYCIESNGSFVCDEESMTKNFWLYSGHKLLALIAIYLSFVLYLGPLFMRNRKPIEMKRIMSYYNVVQIILNFYLITHIGYNSLGKLRLIGFLCPGGKVDYLAGLTNIYFAQVYFSLKAFDFLDTVFSVLRKKSSQITFLHLYHHTVMVLAVWITYSYYLDDFTAILLASMNSFVHVVMYSYYFMTSVGFAGNKVTSLIKPFITRIQIVQFILLLISLVGASLYGCHISISFLSMWIFIIFTILLLFLNFYAQAYRNNKPTKIANGQKIK